MPTYPTGCKGVVRSGNACSSRGWFTIIFVATVIKSVPTVLDTKGKEREARRLHSITWQTRIGKYIKQVTFWYHWQPRILDPWGRRYPERNEKRIDSTQSHDSLAFPSGSLCLDYLFECEENLKCKSLKT